MAFDDTFRPRFYIHEQETFELLGKPKRIQEIRPSNFDGPVLEWADYRGAVFNDTVAPIMTFPEMAEGDIHRVSWVYHSGLDPEVGTTFSQHHVACDCSMMAELSGEPSSIYECDTLQKTLNRRAGFVRSTLMWDKLFRAIIDSEDSRSEITLDRNFLAAESILWIMRQDREHPESWMANVVSGEHSVSLLGLILQVPPDEVRPLVEDLAEDNRLEIEGEVVKLPLAA